MSLLHAFRFPLLLNLGDDDVQVWHDSLSLKKVILLNVFRFLHLSGDDGDPSVIEESSMNEDSYDEDDSHPVHSASSSKKESLKI